MNEFSSSSSDEKDPFPIPKRRQDPNDNRAKVMLKRVIYVERHLGKLCGNLTEFTKKTAALRNKNDEMAKGLSKFAVEDKFNTTSKLSLSVLSHLIVQIGDQRNAEVQRLEAKVITPLSSYGSICKHLKADLRAAVQAEAKRVSRLKDNEKLNDRLNDPRWHGAIAMARDELEKATAESSRLDFQCQDQLSKFEYKRVQDLKDWLLAFLRIEMNMHAKALEMTTMAYHFVEGINPDIDLTSLIAGLDLKELKPEREPFKPSPGAYGHRGRVASAKERREKVDPRPKRTKSDEGVGHEKGHGRSRRASDSEGNFGRCERRRVHGYGRTGPREAVRTVTFGTKDGDDSCGDSEADGRYRLDYGTHQHEDRSPKKSVLKNRS